MQNNFYTQILSRLVPTHSINETLSPYQTVEERHAQILWFEQKHLQKLKTAEGEEIEVISPGLWNSGSGPDFKKAHLRIGKKELRGDIEVHLVDAGWKSHGHDKDPRYNDVILHLSFWPSKQLEPIFTASGRRLLQTYLQPAIHLSLNEIVSLIDIELYPYLEHTSAGNCAENIFEKLSPTEKNDFFESAAEWRLFTKARRLKQCAIDDNEAFLIGMCQALGYKNNAQAFTQLYHALKEMRHLEEKPLFSKALELCGFFEDPYKTRWGKDSYYDELFSLKSSSTRPSIRMDLHQIRPFNHPVRRIAYLVKFLLDPKTHSFFEKIFSSWNLSNETFSAHTILPEYDSEYWQTHYIFGSKTQSQTLRLLGVQTQQIVFINVLLPLFYDNLLKTESNREIERLKQIYYSIRSNDSGKKRYLTKRFFGGKSDKNTFNNAILEQGALQLHADFCVHFETSCEGCPFIHKYHEQKNK